MANNFQVNLQIGSGAYFHQTFLITNPDYTPVDLTDCNIFAAIAKHSRAVDATKPYDDLNTDAMMSFQTGIIDAEAGKYYIELTEEDTLKLEEGKYVYNVMIEIEEHRFVEAAGGLVFVTHAFGLVRNQETDEEEEEPDLELED